MTEIRLGTRGSQLALWQAHAVAARIEATGGAPSRIVVIKTSGDRLQDAPLSDVGGKRLFVKEIEDALLRNEIDIAVHSCKDMPAVLPEGLAIGGVLPREDPHDALVLPAGSSAIPAMVDDTDERSIRDVLAQAFPNGSRIGTGSVRRIAQLVRVIPGARFSPIRGNLDTRLRKLDTGEYDALVLAVAGLRRLGFESRISFAVPAAACVPAPGQGIVAIEVRENDEPMRAAAARINDADAGAALAAERAFVEALGGGCQTPMGAIAQSIDHETMELLGVVVSLDGNREVHARARGARANAADLGRLVARQLIADGAEEILAEARGAQGAVQGIQP